ncbi:hypothetical protein AOE01nite_14030 [Acetobacter oeni]|uniref:Uncharacterized protein n=1 Tax=Acetobacter oeni TaxID=304077 RepID=A0A511XJS0_9PROT|nr:hypothetical protein AOE01nite_14030 [Acetobacter oeni]
MLRLKCGAPDGVFVKAIPYGHGMITLLFQRNGDGQSVCAVRAATRKTQGDQEAIASRNIGAITDANTADAPSQSSARAMVVVTPPS